MQMTFIVQLACAINSELKHLGFEVRNVDVTENMINELVFSKECDYRLSIFTEERLGSEYLKIKGKRVKEIQQCTSADQLEPWLGNLKAGDRITIQNECGVNIAKIIYVYDIEYNTKYIDKEAIVAIAKDMVGDIINH